MLNYIWGGMILLGIVVSAFTGKLDLITGAAIDSAKEAVATCIGMLGIVSMWTGLMKIAEKAGLIDALSNRMGFLMKYLFPGIPVKSRAIKYISYNFVANALGVGWAATPAGLKAMEELQTYNPKKDTASREMCMFLTLNMSSLQIVSVNIIAYRAQYGSADPSEIIGPGIAATFLSTVAAVIIAKFFERLYYG